MANKIYRLAPTGNMDKDSDIRNVGKGERAGDYLDANNIQAVDSQGNVQGSVPPTLGNEFAFDLGSVSQQNKRYRITFDGDATKQHELKFLPTQRDANMVVGTGTDGALAFNGTQASFISAFNTAISGSGVSWLLSTPTATTVEIELASYPMYQWFLDSVGVDVVDFVCIAEAIPVDLAGPLKDIGSYDLLGDLFVFSTTQDNEPTAITPQIILVGPTSGGFYTGPLTTVTFNGNHGLIQGQWIRITESDEQFLNGIFIVHSVIDPQTVRIVTSTAWGVLPPVTTLGTPQVFIHPTGIGEIGVAQKDDNTDAWTYTRLLRSVELNFVSKWQVDSFSRRRSNTVSIYLTDDYNPPRTLEYVGAFATDGFLSYLNPDGQYTLDNISEATPLQIPEPPSKIQVIRQSSLSGNLTAGVKMYMIRQRSGEKNFSQYSVPSKPVLVLNNTEINGKLYGYREFGGYTSRQTTKINYVEISGFLPRTFFPDVDLFVIEYTDSALVARKIHSFKTPVSGEYIYEHDGLFDDNIPVDIGEILAQPAMFSVIRAKNIREIDLRNVLSNVAESSDIDLSPFCEKIRHRIVPSKMDEYSVRVISEYQSPENIDSKMGLMINETYRVSCRAYIRGLGWTSWQWVDDIRIDTDSVNTSNPSDNRRIAGLPSNNLVEVKPQNIADIPYQALENNGRITGQQYLDTAGVVQTGYVGTKQIEWYNFFRNKNTPLSQYYDYIVPQLEFEFDWSVSIPDLGNASAADLITHLEFGIGDVPRSVKSSGIGIMGVQKNQSSSIFSSNLVEQSSVFEFPFHQMTGGAPGTDPIPNYPIAYSSGLGPPDYIELNERRDIVSYYSAEDMMFGGDPQFTIGNSLLVFGSVQSADIITGPPTSSFQLSRSFYSLLHPFGPEYNSPPTAHSISNRAVIEDDSVVAISPSDTFERIDTPFRVLTEAVATNEWPNAIYNERPGNKVFEVSPSVPTFSEPFLTKQYRGIVYAQVYSDERPNFQRKRETNYTRIGGIIEVSSPPQNTQIVEGGDTYTSVFFFLHREGFTTANDIVPLVLASQMAIVSQTRSNPRVLKSDLDDKEFVAETFPIDYGFTSFTPAAFANALGLSWARTNGITIDSVPNHPIIRTFYGGISKPNIAEDLSSLFQYPAVQNPQDPIYKNSKPTRIRWSEKSDPSELSDSYRVFLPLNFKDLDLSFGEIFHHENVNGELFTVQPRKWQRQLFNTRGELQVSGSATGALIGDGSVLSRDGQTLSRYGTQNKWSCILGASDGGKDTLYWYNAENGLFMRFGADGTVVISERARFRSYANKAAKWLRGKDTPAFEQGIRAVWDDRSKEVIWTFTGWRTVTPWQNSGQFLVQSTVGTVVSNPNAPSDTYENLPRFFRCTVAHANSSSREPGVGAEWQDFWEQVAYDDFDYYSVFTVAFNEATNGFKTFYGHIPKTYLKWRDTFLSSHPVLRNMIFEHRKGLPTTWYGRQAAGVEPKVQDAHVEVVLNEMPEQTLRGVAVRYLSDRVPDRVDYTTRRHRTHDTAATLVQVDDYYTGPIRNDETVTGNPDGDGQPLSGDYLRIRFTIFGGTYNLLYSMVVKIFDRLRRVNR